MNNTGVVHFTIGDDCGRIITNIAQEHLLYNNNPEKAIKAITDSLIGCPLDYALDVIGGKKFIGVDVSTQECFISDDGSDFDYGHIDFTKWCNDELNKIHQQTTSLYTTMKVVDGRWGFGGVKINYSDIFKYIANGKEERLDELIWENEEISEMELFIKTLKSFITLTARKLRTIDWIVKTYKIQVDEFHYLPIECKDELSEIHSLFITMSNGVFNNVTTGNIDVDSYLEAEKAISETISDGIKPVDITDNYNAGWLAPNGDFYGLNGEIANMLHNQIADAMVEAGIIDVGENNVDSWLEQQGWCRIHDGNVQFGGCLNHKLGIENVDITEEQINAIALYGNECFKGVGLTVGWKRKRCTGTMFKMQARDLTTLYWKYFSYDNMT